MLQRTFLMLILAAALAGVPLAQAQPDLTYTLRPGWDYPLVPSDTDDAMSGDTHVSPTLPGNLPGTYWNASGTNDGTSSTEEFFDTWLLADDEVLDEVGWFTEIIPGAWFYTPNWGPVEIRGGRHTLEHRIDVYEDVAELDETNNRWGHQFIWTPLELSPAGITRPAPPDRFGSWDAVVDGSILWYNCDGLRMPTTGFWNAVVLWSDDPTANYDVRLHNPSTGSESGFGEYLTWSGSLGQGLDCVIQNANVSGLPHYDAGIIGNVGTGDYHAVHVISEEPFFGDTVDRPLAADEFLILQEFYVSAANLGPVSMIVDIDPADGPIKALYMNNEFAFGNLLDYDLGAVNNEFGRAHIGVDITDEGYHCLVIYREPIESREPMDLSITIGPMPPDFRPYHPPGWHSPLVPRPLDDGTIGSVPLPTELIGNAPATYYNFAIWNASPTPSGATLPVGITVDADDFLGFGSPIDGFGATLRVNYFFDPIRSVRGGRHTLSMNIDYSDIFAEIYETNNTYGEQYVWSPLELPAGSTVTRDAPPDRNADRELVLASGNPFFLNCDGLRLPDTAPPLGEDRYWQAVAVAPGPSSEVDLQLHEVVPGAQDGFAALLAYSFWLSERSHFVLVNFNLAEYQALDAGVIRWIGLGDYQAAAAASNFLGDDPVGTFGPFGLNLGEIVNLHELYLSPGQYAFQLQNDSGDMDWGFAMYPQDQPFLNKGDVLGASIAYLNGPGGDEFINVEVAELDYYCLAVWKEMSADVGGVGTYNIRGILGTTAVEDDEQLPDKTALAGIYPNPFNPQTTVAFELARSSRVEIGVYDVQGSLVRTLVSESYPAGRHEVVWNGRDDGGREVASGTYFARLDAGSVRTMQKMTLLK